MHGRGRFEWAASGEVYNGHWVKGKMTGEGIKVQSDGCRLQGAFLGGELHGWAEKVCLIYPIYTMYCCYNFHTLRLSCRYLLAEIGT